MGSQQFCLRWNNHQSNMLNVFDQLLQNEALVDVTLACEGLSLKAHKVVLSACSPYFQALFLDNPCRHPIVFLKDVRFTDLKALVDFMYKGEVNVSQEQLNVLLQTAESLKVRGLAEVTPESAGSSGESAGGNRSRSSDAAAVAAYHAATATKIARRVSSSAGVGLMSDSPPPPLQLSSIAKDHSAAPTPPGSPPPPSLQQQQHQYVPSSNFEQFKRCHSPPAKRRKAKPRKRIAENSMMTAATTTTATSSDHEDSVDASPPLDLSTASPETLESCMDIHDNNLDLKVHSAAAASQQPSITDRSSNNNNNNNNNDHPGNNMAQLSSILHLDVDVDNFQSHHDGGYGSNQNQSLASPSGLASSHRMSMISKVPTLMSVMTTAPLPSTSATQASIQDIRRLCQYSRQSQQHKPTWTEEDMVQALEAVQSGRLTYALAARKFDIPKATLHYYVILMKAVEAVRSGRMTAEIAAIKYNVRTSILLDCLFGRQGGSSSTSATAATGALPPPPSSSSSASAAASSAATTTTTTSSAGDKGASAKREL